MSDPVKETKETIGNWPVDIVPGEMKAMLKEEHLCLRCFGRPICKVAAAVDPEMMAVVSRCAMFLDSGE